MASDSPAILSSAAFSLAALAEKDRDTGFLVQHGEVNLFLPRPAGGAPLHVGTLTKGGLLRPVGESDMGLALQALPSPDARPEPIPISRAPDDALDAWVLALSGRLVTDFPRDTDLRAVSLAAPATPMVRGCVLVARREVRWVDLGTARGLLFGQDPVSGLIALPPGGWLLAETGGEARVLTTAEARATPDFLNILAGLEAVILEQLAAASMLERVDDLNRIALDASYGQDALAQTRRRASLLIGRELAQPVATDSADPRGLFAVARLVIGESWKLERPSRLKRAQADLVITLPEIAHASNLRLQPVSLSDRWWQRDAGPLLGELVDGTPVALTRDWRGYRARNPRLGIDERMNEAMAERVSLKATELIRPLPARPVQFGELLPFGLRHVGLSLASLAGLTLASAALAQVIPLATGYAFSSIIPSRLGNALLEIGIAIGMVAIVAALVTLTTELVKLRMETWAKAAAFAGIWDRMIRLPLPLLLRRAVADLALRAAAAQLASSGLRTIAVAAATSLGFVVSSLIFIVYNEPYAGLAALAMALIEIGIASISGMLQVRAFSTGEEFEGLADSSVLQFVNGITKLRLAGAEDRAFGIWASQFLVLRDKLVRARRVVVVHESLLAGLGILWTASLYAVIFLIATDGRQVVVPLAEVLAVISAFAVMIGANAQLSRVIVQLCFLKPPIRFAAQMLREAPEPTAGLIDPGRVQGRIELNAVSFRYGPDAPALLRNVSLTIEPGEFIGIVGRSGAGKTTLAKLMLGFMPVSAGSIQIDGHDLRGLDVGALRRQIGVVLQNGRIMPGTLLEAVRGTTQASENEIWTALEAASMASDVRAMPMGLHTLLTDASRLMSGGQVQRVLLARALVQKPALLILDEATSALDDATQEAAMRAVVALSGTRIVIAHRLSTLRHADRILRIEEGGAIRMMSFQELTDEA